MNNASAVDFDLAGIPATRWGPSNERVILAVHGMFGNRRDESVQRVARIAVPRGLQVVSIDLPGHGGRDDIERLVPWHCIPEIRSAYDFVAQGPRLQDPRRIHLFACSLGAYFSILALHDRPVERALLQAPLVDMRAYLERTMNAHEITEQRLREEYTITVPGGQTLDWKYWEFARGHPCVWRHPSHVLWWRDDQMVPSSDIQRFAEASSAAVHDIDGGHHLAGEHDREVSSWLAESLG